MQHAQALERIGGGEQRPVAVLPHPLVEVLRPRAKVDHRAPVGEAPPVVLGEHRAAAGGEHDALERGELRQGLGFAHPEARLALDVEDGGHCYAAAVLDLVVRIDEAQLQPPCEQPPDGGLASAHHADEEQVARPLHGGIVGTKTAGGTRPCNAAQSGNQRMLRRSFMMRGVMKTSSSVLPVATELFLNSHPSSGKSPSSGTLVMSVRSFCS